MSTKSYLKFRTIRDTPQKWVGFGKPLLLLGAHLILRAAHELVLSGILGPLHSIETAVDISLVQNIQLGVDDIMISHLVGQGFPPRLLFSVGIACVCSKCRVQTLKLCLTIDCIKPGPMIHVVAHVVSARIEGRIKFGKVV